MALQGCVLVWTSVEGDEDSVWPENLTFCDAIAVVVLADGAGTVNRATRSSAFVSRDCQTVR